MIFEYVCNMFEEMLVMTWSEFWSVFITIVSHVLLPASIRVSTAIWDFLTRFRGLVAYL
jgi:hypothetical protein